MDFPLAITKVEYVTFTDPAPMGKGQKAKEAKKEKEEKVERREKENKIF